MVDSKIIIIVAQMFIPLFYTLVQLEESGWTSSSLVKNHIRANFFQFIAYLVVLLSLKIDLHWLIDLSNIFIIVSAILVIKTTFIVFNIKTHKTISILRAVLCLLAFGVLEFVFNSRVTTVFVLCLSLGVAFLYSILLLYLKFGRKSIPLLRVFTIQFLLFGIFFILIFLLTVLTPEKFTDSTIFTIHIFGVSIFMIMWNYSIQLKKSSMLKLEVAESMNKLYKTQADISILSHSYLEKSVSCSLTDIYSNIFDLIYERFSLKRVILFLEKDGDLVPAYYRGVSLQEVHSLLELNGSEAIGVTSVNEMMITDIYVGDLPEGYLKKTLLNMELIGAVSFPLCANGKAIGCLSVGIQSNSTIINRDRDLFSAISKQFAVIIYNARIHNELLANQRELKMMSTIDKLTNIYNRTEFLKQFRREFRATKRHGGLIFLIIVRIGNLKEINDRYGNDAGNKVLIDVKHIIEKQLRVDDLFARYGAKEFGCLLVKSSKDGGLNKITNIVKDISGLEFYGSTELKVAASCGYCCYEPDIDSVDSMLKEATSSLTF